MFTLGCQKIALPGNGDVLFRQKRSSIKKKKTKQCITKHVCLRPRFNRKMCFHPQEISICFFFCLVYMFSVFSGKGMEVPSAFEHVWIVSGLRWIVAVSQVMFLGCVNKHEQNNWNRLTFSPFVLAAGLLPLYVLMWLSYKVI